MHRTWLVLAALTLVGCFRASEENGPDSRVNTRTADAGPGGPLCGNGVVNTGEDCEPTPALNLNGETCATATVGAHPDGRLGCSTNCSFNVRQCTGGGAGGIGGVGGVGGG